MLRGYSFPLNSLKANWSLYPDTPCMPHMLTLTPLAPPQLIGSQMAFPLVVFGIHLVLDVLDSHSLPTVAPTCPIHGFCRCDDFVVCVSTPSCRAKRGLLLANVALQSMFFSNSWVYHYIRGGWPQRKSLRDLEWRAYRNLDHQEYHTWH